MLEKILLVLCDDFTKSIEACNEGDKEKFSLMSWKANEHLQYEGGYSHP